MSEFVKSRASQRAIFTKYYNTLEAHLTKGDKEVDELAARFTVFEKRYFDILKLDAKILEEHVEDDITSELELADEYSFKYQYIKRKMDSRLKIPIKEDDVDSLSSSLNKPNSYRYPKLELVKYNGDISGWIGFWAQFSSIHEDSNLPDEQKFQYLIQATVPGSRARTLVDSYPPSAKNYSKAVLALQERFGRTDLLVEYYIRELLKLVCNHRAMRLAQLFDKLEAQLRALESLNINSDSYAAILFPLVESCLPVETLRVWQRKNVRSESLKVQMDNLLKFLKDEVEAEERVDLATSDPFPTQIDSMMRNSVANSISPDAARPTAADLTNLNLKDICPFCNQSHDVSSCGKAQKMSINEKRAVLSKLRRCFSCTKLGHSYQRCRARCAVCHGRHILLMCGYTPAPSSAPGTTASAPDMASAEIDLLSVNHSLTVTSSPTVFLQTFAVLLRNGDKVRRSRVLVDSGSQRSYVRTDVVAEMGYQSIGDESLIHSLFGGGSLGVVKHKQYKIRLLSLDGRFACNFSVLDHRNIASYIPTVVVSPGLKVELESANIQLVEDMYGPIDVLIGADIAGKIWSAGRETLPCGAVALETRFGWTILGTCKEPNPPASACHSNLATTYTMTDIAATDMCDLTKLESIGTQDPAEQPNKESKRKATLEHITKTVNFIDEEASQLQHAAPGVFAGGGFNLAGWEFTTSDAVSPTMGWNWNQTPMKQEKWSVGVHSRFKEICGPDGRLKNCVGRRTTPCKRSK